MKRVVLVVCVMAALAIGAFGGWRCGPFGCRAGAYSVILIVVDTLRADRLSQYGHHRETGKKIDRYLSKWTRFENCRSRSPWTRSSMATMFTGIHPARHGVTSKYSLAPEVTTLAEALKSAGLATAGFSLNPYVSRATGLHQGFDHFVEEFRDHSTRYADIKRLKRLVYRWLRGDETRGPAPESESFFLFMLSMNVHGPYEVPRRKQSVLLGHKPTNGFEYYGKLMKDILKRGQLERRQDVTPEILKSLEERYDTAVRYTMDELTVFLRGLEKKRLYDDSLIVLVADHGEELFDHGGFSHGWALYDELLHVPLFVKLPHQREGRVVTDRVAVSDLYPTILDALDIPLPAPVDGHSLMPLLEGNGAKFRPGRPDVFTVDWSTRCVAQAVIDWPWKLLHISSNYEGLQDENQLYNLETDPREQLDQAAARPDLVARLSAELARGLGELDSGDKYKTTSKPSKETMEQLEALGYVQ